MTAVEMSTLFGLKINSSSNTNDELGDDEISLYLNSAVNRFIKQRYTGNNYRQIAFEGDDKRVADLRTLLTNSPTISKSSATSEIPNSARYTVPSDFMFYVDCSVIFTRTDVSQTNTWVQCKTIKNSEIRKHVQSGHNKPYIREPLVVFRDATYFTVIIDDVANIGNLSTASLTYIKEPAVINVDSGSAVNCDLPNHTHEEIVDMAVNIVLEVEESKRGQTNELQLSKIE